MTEDKARILLVDDDEVFSKVFANELTQMGFHVAQGYGKDVVTVLIEQAIEIVILDIVMPGTDGLQLLETIKSRCPAVDVIMLTGNASIDNAIASMKKGAYDYVTKPVELERVEQVLQRCLEKRRLASRNQMLKNRVSDLREGALIGRSPATLEVKSLIGRFADSDSTVLIRGESGTGKELVANLIHKYSSRRDEPFIIVDCTALKESLLESELFGHERGAFTGAVTRKHGIFEIADGGTIFLDEIGDIPQALQVKLLRVVETKAFRRLGGNERINVDVRLLAATNRDLQEMVRKGEFREDLYYRINVVSILLPPLRDHPDDIPELVDHFLGELRRSGDADKRFSDTAIQSLTRHDWPGNVRELRNLVERSVLLAESDTIEVSDLPINVSPLKAILRSFGRDSYPTLDQLEEAYIAWILERTGGNKQLAARILNIDRKTILRRLAQGDSEE
ncbi:MAG: sigma-54-dependent Fis family transcriptional regulator [candidate division Zixibacteria bacterium]|nr:sigma-54-dependent Fis family transcriptional regulator [candidate division Zixibacteria bacterium]